MAYDEKLAGRVRDVLGGQRGFAEKKIFGGLTFMLHGDMCCGVVNGDLVVRVGPERYEDALARPDARPMDFTGRSMKGMVYVGPGGYRNDEALERWVRRGVDYALSLQPK